MNKTQLKVEKIGMEIQKMPEIRSGEHSVKLTKKKKNLNDLNSIYLSSSEEEAEQTELTK